jgi:hypothetical protein
MIRRRPNPSSSGGGPDLEALLTLQSEGMKARSWGMSSRNNPVLQDAVPASAYGDAGSGGCDRHEAWQFGWSIEDEWLKS